MTRTRHKPADAKIRDLPPEERAEAVKPLVDALDSVLSLKVGEVAAAMKGSDLFRLSKKFQGGEKLEVLQGKRTQRARINPAVEASLEAKLARIRSEPNPAEVIPFDLYEQLSDPSFICPRVGRAVEQVVLQGFTDKPLKAGIRFIRKTHDVDGPVSDDVGCILLFHFPVDASGRPVKGLSEADKPGHPVCAVAVEFDQKGEIESVRRYDVARGDKFRSPFNAYISVVPDEARGDEDYYFRSVVLKPASFNEQRLGAQGKTVQDALDERADQIKDLGRLVGVSRTIDGDDLRVYQIRVSGIPQRFGILRGKDHVVKAVYGCEERPCPQTVIRGTPVGVFIEPRSCGIPLRKRLADVEKEVAVEDRFWMGHLSEIGYEDRKRMTRDAIEDIASAVAPLQLEEKAERDEDIIRFMADHAPVVPFLIGLREEINTLPDANRRMLPEELVNASYSQLYAAAVYMQREGRVLNETYPLESLANFREVMDELGPDHTRRMFGSTELIISPESSRIIQRINALEHRLSQQMSDEHTRLREDISGHVEAVVGKASTDIQGALRSDINRINASVAGISEDQQQAILEGLTEGLNELKSAWPEQAGLIADTLKKGADAPNLQSKLQMTIPIIPFFLQAQVEGNAPGFVRNALGKLGRIFKGLLDSADDIEPQTLALYGTYMQQQT
ncbi:MAG: hypothetical protein ABH834_04230 [Candidatus Altiarchaeota archaeon]